METNLTREDEMKLLNTRIKRTTSITDGIATRINNCELVFNKDNNWYQLIVHGWLKNNKQYTKDYTINFRVRIYHVMLLADGVNAKSDEEYGDYIGYTKLSKYYKYEGYQIGQDFSYLVRCLGLALEKTKYEERRVLVNY